MPEDKIELVRKRDMDAIIGEEDKIGNPPGRSLFFEFKDPNVSVEPIYSIKEFHKTFVELGDLTEYKAAIKLVGSWEKWERIKTRFKAFQLMIDEWKQEIRTRLMSEAQEKILNLMQNGKPSVQLAAAKWLAEQGWDKTTVKKAPNARAKEREQLSKIANIPDDDLKRIEQMTSRQTN